MNHPLSPFLAAILQRAADRGCRWAQDKLDLDKQLHGQFKPGRRTVQKAALGIKPGEPLEAAWETAKAGGPAAKARFMAENRDAIRAYLGRRGELK